MSQTAAAKTLREKRWKDGVYCVHCSSDKVVKNGKREDQIQQYRCKSCGKSFNDRTKTVFEDTQMRLDECFKIIQKDRNSSSVRKISKKINRSWKTVNDFLRKCKTGFLPADLISEYRDRKSSDLDYSKFGCGNSLEI